MKPACKEALVIDIISDVLQPSSVEEWEAAAQERTRLNVISDFFRGHSKPYRRWLLNALSINEMKYSFTLSEWLEVSENYLRGLFKDVEKRGIVKPITIIFSEGRIKVDGIKRLAAALVTGVKTTHYQDGGATEYAPLALASTRKRKIQERYELNLWLVHRKREKNIPNLGQLKICQRDILKCVHEKQLKRKLKSVVDVGAGCYGGMSLVFEAEDWTLVDSHLGDYPKDVDGLRKKTVACEAENIELPTNSADLVFCTNALDHFAYRFKSLCEIGRILKFGGWFALWVDCRNPGNLHMGHRQLFTHRQLKEELSIAGFEVVSDFNERGLKGSRSMDMLCGIYRNAKREEV